LAVIVKSIPELSRGTIDTLPLVGRYDVESGWPARGLLITAIWHLRAPVDQGPISLEDVPSRKQAYGFMVDLKMFISFSHKEKICDHLVVLYYLVATQVGDMSFLPLYGIHRSLRQLIHML
jgi:hypothetical protein